MSRPSTLDTFLAQAQRRYRAPSISAAVFRGEQVRWQGAVGRLTGHADGPAATPDTAYRIGSITKTFTAVTVLRLVAEQLVGLDDPITGHLPELRDIPGMGVVTIGALLTHGAGLTAETTSPWWERSVGRTWEQLLPSIRRVHPLGRRFHYSNVGFAVLGQLVARARGRGWFAVLQDEVLNPLGLRHTSYLPGPGAAPGLAVHPFADLTHAEPAHDAGAMAPAGQLWSTTGDLARWAGFLAGGSPAVLPDPLRLAMHVPSLVDDTPGRPWTRAYGLGLDVVNRDGVRYLGHGGSMPGFLAALRVDPASGDGVAVLANSTGSLDLDLAFELLDEFRRQDPAVPAPWTADAGQADLAPWTGQWFWGPRPFRLHATGDGGVRLDPVGGSRGSRFAPTGEGTWVGLDEYWAGETLVTRRAGDTSYLDLGSFRFTRTPYDPDADLPGGADPAGWH